MSESQNNRPVAVSIKNLSKSYPTPLEGLKRFFRRPVKPAVEALSDVSFDIFEGEIFGLIGRNGAGKTTLTKIIATLVQPTNGSVNVKGFDSVRDEVQVRSLIGFATAEERSFYWRLTIEQNLMFFARLYGMKDSQARKRIIEHFFNLKNSQQSVLQNFPRVTNNGSQLRARCCQNHLCFC
jgi:ABC-type multidrug transport system ATPase subunit